VPGARARAERGELAFGTIDCFLLWRLTGGTVHATDVTNASRTMLYDIHRQQWDEDLCRLIGVPLAILPQSMTTAACSAPPRRDCSTANPIAGMAGDQQAALFGQACFKAGEAKSTYGTGCFTCSTRARRRCSRPGVLLTTAAYRLLARWRLQLEGSIFVAGAAIKWLRDGLGVITSCQPDTRHGNAGGGFHGVYMVPAFAGLGAPYWDPTHYGAIYGLTLGTTQAHSARASALKRWASRQLIWLRRWLRTGPPACGLACRWHGGKRLALPVPRRLARHAGRATRSSSRRPRWARHSTRVLRSVSGAVSTPSQIRRRGARFAFDGCRAPCGPGRRMAGRGLAHAGPALREPRPFPDCGFADTPGS
jgi:hypothetical protein